MLLSDKEKRIILGRDEWDVDFNYYISQLAGKNVLITGGAGSLGQALVKKIEESPYWPDINMIVTDLDMPHSKLSVFSVDVTDRDQVRKTMFGWNPDIVFHFAADKHAPHGEFSPANTKSINLDGSMHVLEYANKIGAPVVFASTCKACNPETVYGATKMIAERMYLNSGHSVARYYNVCDTADNVFEIWEKTPKHDPLEVTNCTRYFITSDEAVGLALYAAFNNGRFSVTCETRRNMVALVNKLYPNRQNISIPPRRGDRVNEPLMASNEYMTETDVDFVRRVNNYNDLS